MKRVLPLLLIAIFLLPATVFAQKHADPKGCQDHELFTRMPDYWIHSCVNHEFDSHPFLVDKGKTTDVEGRLWDIRYYPENYLNPKPSELQIIRNFENAVLNQGGKVVYKEKAKATFTLTKDGKEYWVEAGADWTGKYRLFIVQIEGMAQDVVANAAVFANDIRATGHAAIYGIYFDTGKSAIKPESAQVIGEIAKLLKDDPDLKVGVVGHTDYVGGIDSNIKLSQARAEAVLQALVRDHGIDPGRLKAFGCGLFAPVASNETEDGRAKNRRVELVGLAD